MSYSMQNRITQPLFISCYFLLISMYLMCFWSIQISYDARLMIFLLTRVLIHIWRAFATVQSESHKRLAWDVPEADILDLSKLGILMEKIKSE